METLHLERVHPALMAQGVLMAQGNLHQGLALARTQVWVIQDSMVLMLMMTQPPILHDAEVCVEEMETEIKFPTLTKMRMVME
jgi:hypothetical protein